jgi:hypothetical protein
MHHDSSLVSRHFSGPTSPQQLLPSRSNSLALAEGAVLLVGLTLLDYVGVAPFADWPVHPFLFAVVLLSAQYGILGGILSALAAIGLSHIDGWPARPIDMSYAAYFGYVWADALSWMLAGLMVGAVTSNRARVIQEQAAKLRKATLAESLIAAQYEVLAQRTHQLERQLASNTETADARPPIAMLVRPRSRPQKSARQNAAKAG